MRRSALAVSLVLVLSAVSAFAQAPAAGAPQTAAPAAPRPAPATPPPAQAAAPQPPAPFPAGAKVPFIDFQRVAQESIDRHSSSAKINALLQKKQAQGPDKSKQLQL